MLINIPGQEYKRARLLVVDDESGIRDLFIHLIGGLGHEVVTVARGSEAIERAQAGLFDIVFCDMMMPGMNGFEVLSGLQESHENLPVVIMTGCPAEECESEARMLGAFAFLKKPFEIGEVSGLIALALARKTSGPDDDSAKN